MRTEDELNQLIEEIKSYNIGENEDIIDELKWKLPQLLEDLRNGNIKTDAVYTTIHIFGEAQYKEAQPEIELFLKSEDSELRKIALNVLGIHWNSIEHRNVYESVLFNLNDDEDNRATAAACLGSVFGNKKDKQILRTLISVFKNTSEHWVVRDSAYSAALHVWGVPPKEWPNAARQLDYTKDVNWELMKEIENYIQTD